MAKLGLSEKKRGFGDGLEDPNLSKMYFWWASKLPQKKFCVKLLTHFT